MNSKTESNLKFVEPRPTNSRIANSTNLSQAVDIRTIPPIARTKRLRREKNFTIHQLYSLSKHTREIAKRNIGWKVIDFQIHFLQLAKPP